MGLHRENPQRHAHHDQGEPLALTRIQIAEGAIDPEQKKEGDVNIIANIPTVKKQTGANRYQHTSHKSARTANIPTEEPGHQHNANPGQHREKAGGGVIIAKKKVGKRIGMKQERPMHHGVVLILAGVIEVIRIERM